MSLRHHTAMQALFVMWYNLARKHEALKHQMQAIARELTDQVWTIKDQHESHATMENNRSLSCAR
jgi:hypothetical protein